MFQNLFHFVSQYVIHYISIWAMYRLFALRNWNVAPAFRELIMPIERSTTGCLTVNKQRYRDKNLYPHFYFVPITLNYVTELNWKKKRKEKRKKIFRSVSCNSRLCPATMILMAIGLCSRKMLDINRFHNLYCAYITRALWNRVKSETFRAFPLWVCTLSLLQRSHLCIWFSTATHVHKYKC